MHTERLERLTGELDRENRAWSRSLRWLALVGAAMLVFLFVTRAPALSAAFLIPAAVLGREMGAIRNRIRRLRMLHAHYSREHTETGEEYSDTDHLYASDLDLFGRGSIFEYMCIARTGFGRDCLARWMKVLAPAAEARARAEAVRELRDRVDLREAIATAGPEVFSDCSADVFTNWLNVPATPFPRSIRLVAAILAAGSLVFAGFALFGVFSEWALLWIALECVVVAYTRNRVNAVIGSIGMPAVNLSIVHDLVRILEKERFHTDRLCSVTADLAGASRSIARLRRLLAMLEARNNPMFTIASWFLLWGTQVTMEIENWRVQYGPSMMRWLEAIGDFEALHTVAVYASEHPDDVWAEYTAQPCTFEAEGLAHPLLDAAQTVCNDVHLSRSTRLWVVSGSNMSGKSTLLRACGLAVVLASMGAPVRARKLRLSHLDLAAAIRIQDSLMDGRSHFYTEVARLKRMIDLAGGANLFFLVDEMLSGTNSEDRRTAAEAVICELVERNAIGLITTHDLALTRIAENLDSRARNLHFADSADSGGLDFDYRLRPGIVRHSNALAIIRMLGIEVKA